MRTETFDVLKRGADLIGSAVLLVVTSPIQAAVAVAVVSRLGRPVLFRQQRPGKDGKLFRLLKFRTMLPVDESKGLVTDEQRLTRFGQLLRSTSLDELPALWNVLTGKMSLVGPRPLLPQYLERYTAEQSRRHEVRPGITGLAQVRGRNELSWEARFALDVEYVDGRSPALDARIIWETVAVTLFRRGISAAGHATMTEFLGSSEGGPA